MQRSGDVTAAAQLRRRVQPTRLTRLGAVGVVALCVLLGLGLRGPFVLGPLLPDEAGMLMVAQHWSDGPHLYGKYWVDRPVLLVLLFRIADVLPGGAFGVRLMGCLVAAVLVACAGWAGHRLAGRRGAGWAALVAAPLSSSYFFAADGFNGKLAAAALVMTSCACTLAAVARRSARAQAGLAALAGILATCALLVQQSFGGAFAFAVVMLLAGWSIGMTTRAAVLRVLAAGVVGALLPLLAVVLWTVVSRVTLDQVWFVTVAYRFEATDVIADSDMEAEQQRMVQTAWLVLLSGVAFLLWQLLRGQRRVWSQRQLAPVLLGVDAMVVVAVTSMVLGGSWWRDYPIQLTPALALAVAMLASGVAKPGRAMRLSVLFAVVAGFVASGFGVVNTMIGGPTVETAVGRWLAASKRPGDTALVTYGNADVLYSAGMTSPYTHLWSLPMRTLDPDLAGLRSTLEGRDAPVWVVEWTPFNAWEIDADGELESVVRERYEHVGSPCGLDVYLLEGRTRELAPEDSCSSGTRWDLIPPGARQILGQGATAQT